MKILFVYSTYIVPFKVDTLICYSDPQTIVILRFCFMAIYSSFDEILLPSKNSFENREDEIVAGGPIWRIRQMRKQFKAQFMDFCHPFHRLVARCIVLVNQYSVAQVSDPMKSVI